MTTRLILLGTGGGPTPKQSRSAPAQAIVVGERAYVVDCGNGVARQMVSAGLRLSSLRTVLITHHHSDHNADFGNLLLLAWGDDLRHSVDCYGPPPLCEMTERFFQLNATDIDIRTRDEGRPPLHPLVRPNEVRRPGVVYTDDRIRISATLVNHPPFDIALAYRLDTEDRSIVISGDTTACGGLVTLAQGADTLVHEVFYPQALDQIVSRSNARTLRKHLVNSHTSVDEVGKIAESAGVQTLVLSHLVPSDSELSDETWREHAATGYTGTVIVGRDLLEV